MVDWNHVPLWLLVKRKSVITSVNIKPMPYIAFTCVGPYDATLVDSRKLEVRVVRPSGARQKNSGSKDH